MLRSLSFLFWIFKLSGKHVRVLFLNYSLPPPNNIQDYIKYFIVPYNAAFVRGGIEQRDAAGGANGIRFICKCECRGQCKGMSAIHPFLTSTGEKTLRAESLGRIDPPPLEGPTKTSLTLKCGLVFLHHNLISTPPWCAFPLPLSSIYFPPPPKKGVTWQLEKQFFFWCVCVCVFEYSLIQRAGTPSIFHFEWILK